MENKVVIVNKSSGRVGISIPDIRLKRVWEKKEVKKTLTFDELQEALYDPGVEYLFREGILYIEDMDTKIKLGLEPEDAKTPQNIIVLNDSQKKRLLTVAPVHEFKEQLGKMSYEQIQDLADFAIENELVDFDRSELIKNAIQVDIISAVRLKRQDKEG